MTMPYDLFVTPYTDPSRIPIAGNGMGQLGQQLQETALAKQKMAQQGSQFQQTHALQTEEMRGKNKYYDDLIDARREATREKGQEKTDRRIQLLYDQFKKAKTAQAREAIRQELTSLGQSVEETETELPDVAADPVVLPTDITPQAGVKSIVKPNGKGKPGSSGDPIALGDVPIGPGDDDEFGLDAGKQSGFEAALADFMGVKPEGNAPPHEQERMGGFGGDLGIPGAPTAQPSAPAKPKRGGRFTIRDREGHLTQIYDEPLEREKSRQAVSSVLEPFIGQASNPEEKAAASMAQKAAAAAMDAGFTMPEATKLGVQAYEKEMGRFKNERRPGSIPTGGGGGLSKEDRMRKGALEDNDFAVIKEIDNKHDMTGVNKSLGNISKMEDLLADAEKDGFKGGAALSAYMKDTSGLTVNREEVGRIIGGAGKLSELEFRLNQYTNGGKLPHELVQGLRAVAAASRKVAQERIKHAGDTAYNYIMHKGGLYASEEERIQSANSARGFFTNDYGDTPAPGKPGGASAPKAADPGKRKAIEEARRLLGGAK